MKEEIKTEYVKRSQKDYPISLKLQIVEEVERGIYSLSEARKHYGIQGSHTVRIWLEKYGSFDRLNKTAKMKEKTAAQRILELEQELALAKKQIHRLEYETAQSDKKVILFDMMVDLAEKEYKIDIRKNSSLK